MQAFQEAMERGEAEHLMPVFNAQERIKKGELKPEDIPYMQRGGVSRITAWLVVCFVLDSLKPIISFAIAELGQL
jgi:hypothetical protein